VVLDAEVEILNSLMYFSCFNHTLIISWTSTDFEDVHVLVR